jgi:hypothetical protein
LPLGLVVQLDLSLLQKRLTGWDLKPELLQCRQSTWPAEQAGLKVYTLYNTKQGQGEPSSSVLCTMGIRNVPNFTVELTRTHTPPHNDYI